jgi:hypothetical protein
MPKPRKTARYECVGGPRDGQHVLIVASERSARLDDALYFVRWYVKRDENGLRLWEKECLVWESHPAEATDAEPQILPPGIGHEPRLIAERPGQRVLEDERGRWWLVREQRGALCFVTHDETRRVEQPPRRWQQLDAAALAALCREAASARARG